MSLLWVSCAGAAVSIALGAVVGAADSWPLAAAGVIGSQATVIGGVLSGPPWWAAWSLAGVVGMVGGLGFHGTLLGVYLALLITFLVLNDRAARTWRQLSVLFVRHGGSMPGRTGVATTSADPVAREFARARRTSTPLTVVSVAPEARHGQRRDLTRAARALTPALRRTDIIVHTARERMVIVLPETGASAAGLLLERALSSTDELRIGTATFPDDGVSWERLKEIAQTREALGRHPAIDAVAATERR